MTEKTVRIMRRLRNKNTSIRKITFKRSRRNSRWKREYETDKNDREDGKNYEKIKK